MSLTKQAKTLSRSQISLITSLLQQTRYPTRNQVVFLLSVKAGLRAKEIASLTWDMVTDAEGNLGSAIHLRDALQRLQQERSDSAYVITTERSEKTSPAVIINLFAGWYKTIGLKGCSSHSGRRTFITNAARKISTVGGSLRDVQMLAGHKALSTTQRYIESDVAAQRRVVDLV
jgi:integrase/recombinase XerD